MIKSIDSKFHMSCGCIISLKELILFGGIFHCPNHPRTGKINKIEKFCLRCGEKIITNSLGFRKFYCDDCVQIISFGRTICSIYNLPEFTDPILWRKDIGEITEDILFNICVGYEAIQIDPIKTMQKDDNRIIIDFKRKIKALKEANGNCKK